MNFTDLSDTKSALFLGLMLALVLPVLLSAFCAPRDDDQER